MPATDLGVSQIGAYVEVKAIGVPVSQVGAYAEILLKHFTVPQVGVYIEVVEQDEDKYGPRIQVI